MFDLFGIRVKIHWELTIAYIVALFLAPHFPPEYTAVLADIAELTAFVTLLLVMIVAPRHVLGDFEE